MGKIYNYILCIGSISSTFVSERLHKISRSLGEHIRVKHTCYRENKMLLQNQILDAHQDCFQH